jgi:hypothetical protein
MRRAPGNSYRSYADDKEGDRFWIHTKTMDARLHKKDGDFRILSHREKPVLATPPEEIQVFYRPIIPWVGITGEFLYC